MAGDWIKFEHASATKPEVCLAAEMLGISRREMVGLLVDYWIWLDANLDETRYGLVTQVSRKSLEEVLHCAGLAAILERIGWANFDDEERTLTVKNWDRHTGKTAKSRALTRDRMKRMRDDSVTRNASPEKRREEKITTTTSTGAQPSAGALVSAVIESPKRQKRRQAIPLPDGFCISERVAVWAAGRYGSLGPYLETFVGRNSASGKTYADWDAAFMNAVREDWYGLRKAEAGAGPAGAWWTSEAGTMGKANELGLSSRGGESWYDFRGRIREAIAGRAA